MRRIMPVTWLSPHSNSSHGFLVQNKSEKAYVEAKAAEWQLFTIPDFTDLRTISLELHIMLKANSKQTELPLYQV